MGRTPSRRRGRRSTPAVLVTVLILGGGVIAAPASATDAPGARPPTALDAALTAPAATPSTPEVEIVETIVVLPAMPDAVPEAADAVEENPDIEPTTDETVDVPVRDGDLLVAEPMDTGGAQTLGVTWASGDLEVRVRMSWDGEWSEWLELHAEEGPDPGTPDAANAVLRRGTESVWLDDAEAVQLAFGVEAPADDVRVALLSSPEVEPPADVAVPGSPSPVPGGPGTAVAAAATGQAPRVISRAEWGAPAQVCTPDVASSLVGAAVHHTAGPNTYRTVAEAMTQIRNDAAYHIAGRGWCDIGYNFVVDKWGNIYEGRAGSMERPVIGVHAGGFNTGTVGVAMLGTYDAYPPVVTVNAVAEIIGWRLGQYGVDPRSGMEYWTGEGENSRYRNQPVWLPRVFGHRDVGYTACPGNGGYAALPTIRQLAWDVSRTAWSSPASSLLRTHDNPTVYLVSGGTRHPIGSMAIVEALSALGPVLHVDGQYLAQWSDGPALRRVLRSPDGTVWFFDASIRLAFASCGQVAAYGMSCADAVPVTAEQIAKLADRGAVSQHYRTTSGRSFYVTNGVRREIADDAARELAGIPTYSIRLTDAGIGYLPYGDPVVRPGLLLVPRSGSGAAVLVTSGGALQVPPALRTVLGLASAAVPMDEASIARVSTSGSLGALVRDGRDGSTLMLTDAGQVRVTDPAVAGAGTPTAPGEVLELIPSAGSTATLFVRSNERPTVYLVREGTRRAIRSWSDLVRLAGTDSPTVHWAAQGLVDSIPLGEPFDAPGSLLHDAATGSVFLLDGQSRLVPVPSFRVTGEIGANDLHTVSGDALRSRTITPALLGVRLECGGTRYVGVGGALHPVRPAEVTHLVPSATNLDPSTCAALPRSTRPMERFLRDPAGTIYLVTEGMKQPIRSFARYVSLGGTPANTLDVSTFLASQYPTGAFL